MPFGGPAPDELLRLTGSTNNPMETVTATGNGTAVYFGPNNVFDARMWVAGAVTGTSPTLDIKFQASADGSTSWTDIGVAFPQVTATSATVVGNLAEPAHAVVRMPATKGYCRIVKTAGGTTPSFTGVMVIANPLALATP